MENTPDQKPEQKLKRIAIVIQETGENGGQGFNVYMDGDTERLKNDQIKTEELSPAEFWGMTIFNVGIQVLVEAGVIKTVEKPQ